uniref:HNH endonuclease n=1 Tax=Blidingia minima TaxID=63414 RepID=A0A8E5J5K3_9CHLO|nr:hypothetical protein [Blidingia minima]
MRGIFNYYRHLKNLSVINYVFYILKFSCAKTLARRQRISMSKILTKYGPQLNIKLILNKNGKDYTRNIKLPILSKLKKEKVSLKYKGDYDPFYVQKFWRTSIKLYGNCCICNSDTDISMHHLNSLKKLKQKNNQNNTYIRSALGRKQIPVCKQCHLDITNGKYNKESPIQLFEKYILL